MATVATKKVWTDEELMRIKHEGKVELVDGEVKLMTPAGAEQGSINANLAVQAWTVTMSASQIGLYL